MDAAATPARDNLSTKTTDISEPEIPNVPRTNGLIAKKFTFDLLSPTDEQEVETIEDEDRNVEEENADGDEADSTSQRREQTLENIEPSTSDLELDNEGENTETEMKTSAQKEVGWYFCGFDDAPFDEDSMKIDDQNLDRSSLIDKTDKNLCKEDDSLLESAEKPEYTEGKETMCGAILAKSESEDDMPTEEPEATESLVDAPSDELENRRTKKSTEIMDAMKGFEEVCCLKLESFRFC